jgi:hypothetical protein
MRPFVALAIVALATPAYAGSHQTGGGGGRLSQVSAGSAGLRRRAEGLRVDRIGVDAEGMFFSHDVRAFGGRVGVRFEHVELAFRALDFNVGPALFGPELGVGF